ncbi:MAG TPA: helix-turn-helix domain-containing protein [Vicinamibacterales bacterium]
MDFGSHVRAAREQRNLSLDDLSARTKIPRQLLVDLEENDVSRWPRHQIYRHGFLRAYASALGLDADLLITRFQRAFPEERTLELVEPPPVKSPKRSPWRLTAFVAALAVVASVLAVLFFDAPAPRDDRSAVQAESPEGAAPAGGASEPARADNATPDVGSTGTESKPAAPSPTVAPSEPVPGPLEPGPVHVEGELVIESEPPGATVVVNNIGRGRTPARVQYLPLGSHTIRLVLAGYESQEQIVTLTSTRPLRTVSVVLNERIPNP